MAIKEQKGVLSYVDGEGNRILLYPAVDPDKTLSIEGEAADAAAVGTALRTMDKDVTEMGDKVDNTAAVLNERMDAVIENAGGSKVYVTCENDEAVGVVLTGTMNGKTYTATVDDNKEALFIVNDCGKFDIVGTEEYNVSASIDILYFGIYYVTVAMKVVGSFDYTEWLTAAGLNAGSYADLDAVLADEAAVRTLMTKTASVDYMVDGLADVPEIAAAILENDYVAKWVNYRDYAYSKLMAEASLKQAMDAAGKYGMYITVPNKHRALVPTLTSNTGSDGGEAFASGCELSDGYKYDAYLAFNGSNKNCKDSWNANTDPNSGSVTYIGYKFASPTIVNKVTVSNRNSAEDISGDTCIFPLKDVKVQGSNNGSEWVDLATYSNTLTGSADSWEVHVSNEVAYLQYRLLIMSAHDSGNSTKFACVGELQFYGRQLEALVPPMTSNTTPSGEASASSIQDSGYEAYKAVAGDNAVFWASNPGDGVDSWWEYDFQRYVTPLAFKFNPLTYQTNATIAYKIQLYDEMSNSWVDACSEQTIQTSNAVTYAGEYSCNAMVSLDNTFETKRIRYYQINTSYYVYGDATKTVANLGAVQIYGEPTWQPKGLIPVMTSNTAPYGEASGSIGNPWHAFDENETTEAATSNTKTGYVQYKFTNPTCVKKFYQKSGNTRTYTISASNDGSDWTELYSGSTSANPQEDTISIDNDNYYLYYRYTIASLTSGTTGGLHSLQFYGRQFEALVPPMTSDNAWYGGELTGNGDNSGYEYWRAFDGDGGSYWKGVGSNSHMIVRFNSPKLVSSISLKSATASNTIQRTERIEIQASHNESEWVTLVPDTAITLEQATFKLSNVSAYKYYKIICTNTNNDYGSGLKYLQFYGTPDYDSRTYIYDHGVEVMDVTAVNTAVNGVSSEVNDELRWVITSEKGSHGFYTKVDDFSADRIRCVQGSELSTTTADGSAVSIEVWRVIPDGNYSSNRIAEIHVPMTNKSDGYLDTTNVSGTVYLSVGRAYGNAYTTTGSVSEWWLE